MDSFLPGYERRQALDPAAPVPIGAIVGPEAFTEVRYLAHARQLQALTLIPEVVAEFTKTFGRDSGGLVRGYRLEDADTVVVALGSVLGTIKDTVDELRGDGMRVGILGIAAFRPFPSAAIREALGTDGRVKRLVVLERALATGVGSGTEVLDAPRRARGGAGAAVPGPGGQVRAVLAAPARHRRDLHRAAPAQPSGVAADSARTAGPGASEIAGERAAPAILEAGGADVRPAGPWRSRPRSRCRCTSPWRSRVTG